MKSGYALKTTARSEVSARRETIKSRSANRWAEGNCCYHQACASPARMGLFRLAAMKLLRGLGQQNDFPFMHELAANKRPDELAGRLKQITVATLMLNSEG